MASSARRLGVLGGGQLGLMLGEAARSLGVEVCFVDPSADACASAVGPVTAAGWDDVERIADALDDCDVATYEWEGVSAALVEALPTPVRPGGRSLSTGQDRLLEKRCFETLGIATAPFRPVDGVSSLIEAIAAVGGPGILKTRSGGYDGKGQVRIAAGSDALGVAGAWGALGVPSIYERMVHFEFEFSIIVVRDAGGTVEAFPPIRNDHERGILRLSRVPCELSPEIADAAREAAVRLAEHLGHVGILTLECFATSDGFVANEFAPRVHNSGHWTIEGASTSQFEQHVRAVMGLPLMPILVPGPVAMRNCIGRVPQADAINAIPGATLHDYGKAPRHARKVGHVTVLAEDSDQLEKRLALLDAIIRDDG